MAATISHDQNFKSLTVNYVSCRLAEISADEWLDSRNLVARLNLPNMKFPPERRVEIYATAVRGLKELELDERKRMNYLDFMYADLDDNERRRFQQEHSEENAIMAGIVSRAREEGMESGMRQFIEVESCSNIEQAAW